MAPSNLSGVSDVDEIVLDSYRANPNFRSGSQADMRREESGLNNSFRPKPTRGSDRLNSSVRHRNE